MKRLIIAFCLLSPPTFTFADSYAPQPPDFKNPSKMADYYNHQIEQRRNENLEQLHDEQRREFQLSEEKTLTTC